VENSCECGNDPSDFIKMLRNYRMASQLAADPVVPSFIESVSFSHKRIHTHRLFM
jgi:hypothetical protein